MFDGNFASAEMSHTFAFFFGILKKISSTTATAISFLLAYFFFFDTLKKISSTTAIALSFLLAYFFFFGKEEASGFKRRNLGRCPQTAKYPNAFQKRRKG